MYHVAENATYRARGTHLPRQDAGVNTLVGLMAMLPPNPSVRARVLRDCIKIVTAALDTDAAERYDD